MSLKAGVRVLGIRPEVVLAIGIVREVYREHGYAFVITSVIDGVHHAASLHYTGCAFDLRLPGWPNPDMRASNELMAELKIRLGDDFDVVLEGDHIHVEFQPKAAY